MYTVSEQILPGNFGNDAFDAFHISLPC